MGRKLACVFILVVVSIVTFIACVFVLPFVGADRSFKLARRMWTGPLLWAAGIRVEVKGGEQLSPDGSYVFVANHQSTADIPVLMTALPWNIRFIAKHTLAWVPLVGWYMKLTGFVFVNRQKQYRAIETIESLAPKLRAGTSIIAFPEGTRSDDGTVGSFKSGPFALATKNGIPIVPVAVIGTARIMPKNSWDIIPGTATVFIGPPLISVGPEPEKERRALRNAARDFIVKVVSEREAP